MKEFFQQHYVPHEHHIAAAMLTLAMLGMGAQMTMRDFVAIVKMPKAFFFGVFVQVVLVPVIAYLMIRFGGMQPGIAVGIALLASMPGGAASNIFTFLGKGNAALSVALTGACTITSLGTVPVAFNLMAGAHVAGELSMPYMDIIREILLYLLAPLAVGMAVGRFAPQAKEGFSKWAIRGSLLLVVTIIVGAVGAGRVDFKGSGLSGTLAVVAFCVICQQVTMWTSRLMRFSSPDECAIVIEVTIRNTLLALLLLSSLFPRERVEASPELAAIQSGAFFVVLFYGGAAMAAAAPPIWYYKRKALAAEAAAAAATPPAAS